MAETPPNILFVFTDDQGYGDVGCYGSPYIDTPNVDSLATEGVRFTDFHAQTLCTPSRASLMTGCYPSRVGMCRGHGIDGWVLFPNDEYGLHPQEVTLADSLSAAGYDTHCIGKWHLGDHHPFLPTDHGFDSYFGVPYSNDMQEPPLPLVRDDEVLERDPDQSTLTGRYTDEAVEYVEEHADDEEPFFCYLAHSMPHVPLHASEDFEGESYRGLYGDVLEEVDHGVGRLLDTLEREGIAEDTLVLYASDNGPWLREGHDGGSSGPLREGKGSAYEGGTRVPFLARWPGVIPDGTVCRELATTMDLLPTLASIAGSAATDAVPDDRIDGVDIGDLLREPTAADTPRDRFVYYDSEGDVRAIRNAAGKKYFLEEGELYDLREDVGERVDVSAEHPDVVDRLTEAAETHQHDIAENGREPGQDPAPGLSEQAR